MSGSYMKLIDISNDGRCKVTTTMTYVFKKTDLNYMSNGTEFHFKKVRTERTHSQKDQTNYMQQKKLKLSPIYESSVYQTLRIRTFGVVRDHII